MRSCPDQTRRAFLKALPAITAGAAALPAHGETKGPHWAMLIDTRGDHDSTFAGGFCHVQRFVRGAEQRLARA